MRASVLVIVALLAVGCGSSSTAPTPVQTLPPVAIDCTLVGTLPCQTPPTASPTPTPTPTGSFTVSGRVSDATSGGLLPGITVVASSGSTVSTDNLGHYAITGVKAGPVSLTFSATSYTTQSKTITLTANATVDVVLQRSAGPGGGGSSGAFTILSLDIPTVQIGTESLITLRFSSGQADTFAWTFGDGTSTTTTTSQAAHTYAAVGSYVVTVRAANATSAATATNTATVIAVPPLPPPPPPPAPSLTVTLTCTVNAHATASPCNVSVVDQTGASVTASLTQVAYDWGDGQVSTVVGSPLASHTYAQVGTYVIRATATANGITGSATKIATVS